MSSSHRFAGMSAAGPSAGGYWSFSSSSADSGTGCPHSGQVMISGTGLVFADLVGDRIGQGPERGCVQAAQVPSAVVSRRVNLSEDSAERVSRRGCVFALGGRGGLADLLPGVGVDGELRHHESFTRLSSTSRQVTLTLPVYGAVYARTGRASCSAVSVRSAARSSPAVRMSSRSGISGSSRLVPLPAAYLRCARASMRVRCGYELP